MPARRKYNDILIVIVTGIQAGAFLIGCSGAPPENAEINQGKTDIPNNGFEWLYQEVRAIDSLYNAGNMLLMESEFQRLLDREDEWNANLDPRLYAWTYDWVGEFYLRLGNLQKAKHYNALAVSRLDAIQDRDFKADIINNQAIIESDLGNYDRAIELLFASMDTYNDDTLSTNFIDFYNNIGTIYSASKNYDLAVIYFEKLMRLAQTLGLEEEYGYYHGNLGQTFFLMGRAEESILHLQQAKGYFAEHGQLNEGLLLNTLLASNYIALGRIDEAEQLLQGNLREAEDKQLWETYVETAISLFELHVAKGNHRAALAALDEGLEKVHITNTARLQLKIYDKLVDYYKGRGDFEAAFTYLQQRNGIRDSTFTASQSEMMRELTVKYETDRKNDQITQLETLNERERRTNVIYLVGLVLLMLILAVIFWLLRRLSAQKNALEEANRTKDRLFSIIAHDLRSPMVALRGMGNLMHHYIGKKDEQKLLDLGNKTGETLARINHLLDNLLNWAVTNSKQIAYHPVEQGVSSLLDDALSVHRAAATAKGVRLQMEVTAAAVSVDLNMASSVLRNLISNAIKHSPSGGTVTIAGQSDSSYYKISIRDEGDGVPQHVMDALYQSEEALLSGGGKESFGLGLRLAMYFAEKGRGKLIVRNEAGGAIAEFYVPLID